jgi:hAT family C-terminal dimerisation region
MARKLIKRVGGPAAAREFEQMLPSGWSGDMHDAAKVCVEQKPAAPATGRGTKRAREQVTSIAMRKGVWKRYGKRQYPNLAKVAVRLLCAHPTSASTERNWSLWGRVYTATRTALGLERAKKLIMFCFNDRCGVVDQNDFQLLLNMVDNLLVDEEPAEVQAAADGLAEAASAAGGAAAAAATGAGRVAARGSCADSEATDDGDPDRGEAADGGFLARYTH